MARKQRPQMKASGGINLMRRRRELERQGGGQMESCDHGDDALTEKISTVILHSV